MVVLRYSIGMSDTFVRIFTRDHLAALATAYPADLNTRAEDMLTVFDELRMPAAHTLLVDSAWRKVGDDLSPDFEQCVFSGLSRVAWGIEEGAKRIGTRERAVKGLLHRPAFEDQVARVRTEVELDEAARHFFVYGLALGISIRHERSLRDLFRSRA